MSVPPAAPNASSADFRRSLAVLESMMNDGASAPAVRMQMREVENFGAKYPPGLRERSIAYIRTYDWIQQRKRRWLRVLAVAAVLSLAGGIAGIQIYRNRKVAAENTPEKPADAPAAKESKPEPETPAVMRPEDMQAWQEALRRARQPLPDLDGYVKALTGLRPRFPAAPEILGTERWLGLLPAYRATLEYGRRVSAKFGQTPPAHLPPYAAYRDFLISGESYLSEPSPYAELLRVHLDRAALWRDGTEQLTHLREQLKGDVMTKLREVVTDGQEGRGQPRYFTLEGSETRATGSGQVIFEVFKEGVEGLVPMPFRADLHPRLQPPAHAKLGEALTDWLHREARQPDWDSQLPKEFMNVVAASEADASIRAILLAELLDLDSEGLHALNAPMPLRVQLVKLCEHPVSFWIAGPESARQGQELRARLDALTPELRKLVESAQQRAALRKADAAGLLRPLTLSAVAGLDAEGRLTPVTAGGAQDFPEYWAIVPREGSFAFEIVAVRDPTGRATWIGSPRVQPGQPLLSPLDGKPTRAMLAGYLGAEKPVATPSTFPVNTWSAP